MGIWLRLALLPLCLGWLCGDGVRAATLETKGTAFLLDGQPFDMWGIRTASASQTRGQPGGRRTVSGCGSFAPARKRGL